MKAIFTLFFLSLLAAVSGQEKPSFAEIQTLPESVIDNTISLNSEYWLYRAHRPSARKQPLLIVLHGGGGTGRDIQRIKGGAMGPLRTMKEAGIDAIVVAPQAAENPMKLGAKGGWVPSDLDLLLEHLISTLPIDPDRIYLTGVSMGGYGTYAWAGVSPQHFAAIAPMVGGIGPGGPKDITTQLDLWGENLAKIPMRAYYGAEDRVVPADRGEMILAAIEKAGGNQAEVIVYDDLGHDAAKRPFSDPKFFKWLFSHTRPSN
tara:strand:+ start:2351 stop:3133 length:783 start_codon:yes stop_codon:yes gene_type:complete